MLTPFPILVVTCMLAFAADAGIHPSHGTQSEAQQPRQRRVGVSLPSEVAATAAEQSGTIVHMPIVEGEAVEKDQVLFKLSTGLQELRVQRLEALSGSSLALEKAKAALEHAVSEKRRMMELSVENIASEKDLADKELDVVVATLEYEQAKLDQSVTSNDLEQARILLEQRTVRSPFSGIVTQILKRPGETSEKLMPVVEVAKLDPLWVEFECPVTDEALFRPGAEVLVSPSSRKSDTRSGTVVYVSMKASPSSHTFRVRIAAPNEDHSWKAGLKMLIQLPDDTKPQERPTPKRGKK